jgi:hypothetical protein
MAVTVVIGPPAGGKSTWVLSRAKPTDIVVDFDRLATALTGNGSDGHDHPSHVHQVTRAARTAAIDTATRYAGQCDVYLIHSSPSSTTLATYRSQGFNVVVIDPGRDVVKERCKTQRPAKMFGVIDRWYRDHAGTTATSVAIDATVTRDW